MNNSDEIKQANKKALPKFLLIMLISLAVGFVIGFVGIMALLSAGEENVADALARAGTIFAVDVAPWLLAACVAAQLLCGLAVTAKVKAILAGWDGEDETVSDRADRVLSTAMWICSILVTLSMFLFAAFYSVGFAVSTGSAARFFGTLALFLAALVISIRFQQRYVDLTKRMYPEKKASVYDMRFQKEWFSQCDEAERAAIGQCSYRAYRAVNNACIALWLVFTLAGMFLGTGFLPVLAICVIWAVGQSVYSWWGRKLSAHNI